MVVMTATFRDGSQYNYEFAHKCDEYRQMVDTLQENDEVADLELEVTAALTQNYWSTHLPGKRRFSSRNEFARFAKSLSF